MYFSFPWAYIVCAFQTIITQYSLNVPLNLIWWKAFIEAWYFCGTVLVRQPSLSSNYFFSSKQQSAKSHWNTKAFSVQVYILRSFAVYLTKLGRWDLKALHNIQKRQNFLSWKKNLYDKIHVEAIGNYRNFVHVLWWATVCIKYGNIMNFRMSGIYCIG